MENKPFHFYASSIGEWRVSEDIESLIKLMKIGKLSFVLWRVPGGMRDTDYKIERYLPVVEGLIYLGSYLYEGGKWHPGTRFL